MDGRTLAIFLGGLLFATMPTETVQNAITVTASVSDSQVDEIAGRNFSITCTVVGDPHADLTNVSWIAIDGMVPFTDTGPITSTTIFRNETVIVQELAFSDATVADSNTYNCTAVTFGEDDVIATSVVSITDPPRADFSPPSVNPDCGGSVTFTCNISSSRQGSVLANDLSVHFVRVSDGAILSDTTIGHDVNIISPDGQFILMATLRIDVSTPEVAGDYQCFVNSTQGSVTATSTLIVNDQPPTVGTNTGGSFAAQVVNQVERTLDPDMDNNFMLECVGSTAGGLPATLYTILFLRNGMDATDGRISAAREDLNAVTAQLLINFTDPVVTDSTQYVCFFDTACGNNSFIHNVTLIAPPATVVVDEENINLVFMMDTTVVCSVEALFGSLAVTSVTWLTNNDGNDVAESGRITQEEIFRNDTFIQQQLNISNAMLADSNTYICRASSIYGVVEDAVNITVATDPPSALITPPAAVSENCGAAVTFSCQVNSSRIGSVDATGVTISWFRITDGEPDVGAGTIGGVTVDPVWPSAGDQSISSMLNFVFATVELSGIYQCRASTIQGNATADANLAVTPRGLDIGNGNSSLTNPPSVATTIDLEQGMDGTFSVSCTGRLEDVMATGAFTTIGFTRDGANAVGGTVTGMRADGIDFAELTIIFQEPNVSTSSEYVCSFVNPCGNASFIHNITVRAPTPTVDVQIDQLDETFNNKFHVTCSVTALFASALETTVQWRKVVDGVVVTNSDPRVRSVETFRNETFIQQTLMFNRSIIEDTSAYLCEALAPVNTFSTAGPFTDMFNLNITFDPPFITEYLGMTENVTDTLEVVCSATTGITGVTSSEETTLMFFRASDGVLATDIQNNFMVTVNRPTPDTIVGTLNIMDGVKAFIDDYICNVTNVQGVANASALVNFTAPPPFIVIPPPAQQTLLPGSTMDQLFTCHARSRLINSSLATIQWQTPDGSDADLSAVASVTITTLNSSDLVAVLNVTGGVVSNSLNYTCVIMNQCGRASATVEVIFQATLALDGVTGNPFDTEFTENSVVPALLAFQHSAQIIGVVTVCEVILILQADAPLNPPNEEKIFPTKITEDSAITKTFSPTTLRFSTPDNNPMDLADLLTIIRNAEYFNRGDEITVATRQVVWRLVDCTSGRDAALGTTNINIQRINDNTPILEIVIDSQINPPMMMMDMMPGSG